MLCACSAEDPSEDTAPISDDSVADAVSADAGGDSAPVQGDDAVIVASDAQVVPDAPADAGTVDSGPCPSDRTWCGFCADLSTSYDNCGACGTTCVTTTAMYPAGVTGTCTGGTCDCAVGRTLCALAPGLWLCTDTPHFPAGCGGCAGPCPPTYRCGLAPGSPHGVVCIPR